MRSCSNYNGLFLRRIKSGETLGSAGVDKKVAALAAARTQLCFQNAAAPNKSFLVQISMIIAVGQQWPGLLLALSEVF